MKAKLTTVLAIMFAVTIAAVVFAVAPAGATQVTGKPFAVTADKVPETNPDLSGTNLVWQEKTGSDWNIYYEDLEVGHVIPLCINQGDQILPRVGQTDPGQPDNHVLVVWEDRRSGDADVYGYDVTTGHAFIVCNASSQQVAPRISGDWVVWQDNRNGNWDIYGATIDPATDTVGPATPICTEAHDQIQPDVSGDTVVWSDTRYGDHVVFAYNRTADYTFGINLSDTAQDQEQPAVWTGPNGTGTIVWRDTRNAATSGTDIYGFDLQTSREFAVCTATGDQSAPAVDQDLVVWNDARTAAHKLDVRGYDLTLQQPFPVVTAATWQGQPTISVDQTDPSAPRPLVVWTDMRNGGIADLWAAALTPWNARITIDNGSAWTRSATASLGLFAQSPKGIVTQMTLTNVGGAVGTAEPYSTVKSPWYLTPGDGRKTVTVAFTDLLANVSPLMSASITLDTHGPTITVPSAVSVKRGKVASIGYRVTDYHNVSPRAAVTIHLLDKHGNIVKVFTAGKAATGTALHHFRFVCRLKVGSYRIRAWATDLAGNHQVRIGASTLTVT